jgi:integrase/recombinase XerD
MNTSRMSLSVYFKPRKTGKQAFIYCRIRLSREYATDFTTHIPYNEFWNQDAQMFTGRACHDQNQRLSNISDDIRILHKELRRAGDVSAYDLRNSYVKRASRRTLLEAYADHLVTVKKNLGLKGFSKGTKKAHTSLDGVLRAYLTFNKMKDIELSQLRPAFASKFVTWMRSERRYTQNYIVRNLNHLKWIIEAEKREGFLNTNPFENLIEPKHAPGPITFLTEQEIASITDNPLLAGHLERVADAFLLQCFTGLAYCDLKRFDPGKHITKLKGRYVIQYCRQKGDAFFTIPVLPQIVGLLKKYNDQVPVVSNQKMNTYLKTIAKTVGIEKRLTTHVGRKTAGTYLLNHDVPLEVVSKILGHASVKTTEKIYAFLLQDTILRTTAHLVAA